MRPKADYSLSKKRLANDQGKRLRRRPAWPSSYVYTSNSKRTVKFRGKKPLDMLIATRNL